MMLVEAGRGETMSTAEATEVGGDTVTTNWKADIGLKLKTKMHCTSSRAKSETESSSKLTVTLYIYLYVCVCIFSKLKMNQKGELTTENILRSPFWLKTNNAHS